MDKTITTSSQKYYEIPVISVREALWHEYFESRERSPWWQAFPQGKSHPSREVQQIIADIVARELRLFRRDPPTLTRERTLFPPLLLSAQEAEKNTAVLRGVWTISLEFEGEDSTSIVSQPMFLHERSFGWTHVLQETRYGDTSPGLICNRTFPNMLQVNKRQWLCKHITGWIFKIIRNFWVSKLDRGECLFKGKHVDAQDVSGYALQ